MNRITTIYFFFYFFKAFGGIEKRINCWAHSIRLIDARLSHIADLSIRRRMRVDILDIQLRNNEIIFNQAISLFHCKWSGLKNDQIDEFLVYFKKFNEDKPGWFEGYSIGDPSQSNAIEGHHKHIKVFEDIKTRSPCIKFINGKGKNLVEEWSKQRSPTFIRSDGGIINNPNQKIYHVKPVISTLDWSNALKWDNRKCKIIEYKGYHFTSDNDNKLDGGKCKEYLKYIEDISNETDFDTLIYKSDEIKVVKLNKEVWENSECSCKYWHKNLKCSHIIALACRLKKASYVEVAYSAPLTSKRKVGRPKDTASALQVQSNELQVEEGVSVYQSPVKSPVKSPVSIPVCGPVCSPVKRIRTVVVKRGRGRPKKSEETSPKIGNHSLPSVDNCRRSKRIKRN